ncbi:MAG TPA: hypothetical protein DEH78_19180, partial [Solibacterales bacterium]|nr:hypothetical protein [Bryobacterales bacterium]
PGNVTLAVANAAITELLIMNFDLNSAVIDGLSVVLPGTSTPSGPLTDPTLLAFSGSVFALFSLSGDPVEFDGGVFFPYVLSYLVAPDGPSEVPEPGVATTMALGLVAIGAGLYRRRRS